MLRIPTETAQPRRFTADEFDRMGEVGIFADGEHVQLLDGEIIAMSPAGDPHAGCVDFLTQELLLHIGRRAQIHVQNPLRLSDRWQPEPDICVLRRRDSFYRDRRPRPEDVLLLVEVAASSLPLDLHDKLPAYAEHAIPEVWIVDLAGRRVLQASACDAGVFRSQHWLCENDTVRTNLFDPLELRVGDIVGPRL